MMIPWQAFIKSCKIIESIVTLGTTLIISPSILEKSLATVHASLGEIWSPTPLCSVEKLKCVQRSPKVPLHWMIGSGEEGSTI